MLIIKYGTTKIELLYVACFSFLFHKLLKYYPQFINNLDCKSGRSCYPSKMVLKKSVGRPATDKLSPVATKSGRTDEQIGDMFGESKDTVRRYIRLTYLIKEIRDMVDDDKLSIRAAVEISYIEPAKQAILVPFMQKYDVTINKAAELREWFDNGGLTDNETVTSLFTDKSAKKESSHKPPNAIKYKQIKSYIPDSVLKEDYQSYVIKALLFYRDNGEDV